MAEKPKTAAEIVASSKRGSLVPQPDDTPTILFLPKGQVEAIKQRTKSS